jgi:hypothetical protein
MRRMRKGSRAKRLPTTGALLRIPCSLPLGTLQPKSETRNPTPDTLNGSSDEDSEAGGYSPELASGMVGGDDVVDEAEVS